MAITRARRGLIVVGDPKVLRTCRHWSALLSACSDRGCVLSNLEYKAKTSRLVDHEVDSQDGHDRSLLNLELDKDDQFYGLFSEMDIDDDDDELYGLFSTT